MTQTTNYNIDKPEANDALSVLVTFNGDMDIIDAAIKGVDDTATTASATATAAGSAAATAQSAAETAQTTATAAASAASSAADAASAAQSTADAKAAIDDTAAAATTTYSSEKIEAELDTKQTTITGAATTITDSNLTTSRALVSNSVGKVAASDVTTTELGYLSGATSNLQAQINNIHGDEVVIADLPTTNGTYTIPSISNYVELTFILISFAGTIVYSLDVNKDTFVNYGPNGLALRDFGSDPVTVLNFNVYYESDTSVRIEAPTDVNTIKIVGR